MSPSNATPESNAELIAANLEAMEEILANVSKIQSYKLSKSITFIINVTNEIQLKYGKNIGESMGQVGKSCVKVQPKVLL